MSSSAVSERASQQTVLDEKETSASANASAGLNLNIFGAIAGAFSGKSTKEKATDGSSTETREESANVKGAGAGNFDAAVAASAEEKGRQTRAAIQEDKSPN